MPRNVRHTNNLRKFFDVPLQETAKTPHHLYRFLDEPNEWNSNPHIQRQCETQKSMNRNTQFEHTGTVAPLRPEKPNRFTPTSRKFRLNNENFMIDPNSLALPLPVSNPNHKQKDGSQCKGKPSERTASHIVLEDDSIKATLDVGLDAQQRTKVLRFVDHEKHCDWKANQLMPPKTRLLLHKMDVVRQKTNKLNKQNEYEIMKQKWLISNTHPKGIIGVDTPLFTNTKDSIYYKPQIKQQKITGSKFTNQRQFRKQLISQKNSMESGILYHCPKEFQHTRKERILMKSKGRAPEMNKNPTFEQTRARLFQGVIEQEAKIHRYGVLYRLEHDTPTN